MKSKNKKNNDNNNSNQVRTRGESVTAGKKSWHVSGRLAMDVVAAGSWTQPPHHPREGYYLSPAGYRLGERGGMGSGDLSLSLPHFHRPGGSNIVLWSHHTQEMTSCPLRNRIWQAVASGTGWRNELRRCGRRYVWRSVHSQRTSQAICCPGLYVRCRPLGEVQRGHPAEWWERENPYSTEIAGASNPGLLMMWGPPAKETGWNH
jgi:hypothetical protein